MSSLRPSLSLLLLAGLCATASAQEVQYLVEGKDKERGEFTGQLAVSYTSGKVEVDRRVRFMDGSEQVLLSGKGTREDFELEALFKPSTGLSGGLSGETAAKPILLQIIFGEIDEATGEDEWCETGTLRGEKKLSSGEGYRVFPLDAERPETTGPSYKYTQMPGVAFIQGEGDAHEVDVNDIFQGGLGDCYFMAGIAAVARTDPQRIRSMIEENADGTFSVYVWKHNYQWEEEQVDEDGFFTPTVKATKVVVDGQFPATYGTSPSYAKFGDSKTVDGKELHELWPMILEKAYAKHKGSYKKIEGGWASTPISFFSGQDAVVDHDPKGLSETQLKKILAEATKKGYPTTLGVPKSGGNSSLNLYGNHYYIFVGLDAEGNALLRNPWGSSHPPRGLTMAELKKYFDGMHVGEF